MISTQGRMAPVGPSTGSLLDSVWETMKDGELYSLADLASVSRQTTHTVVTVLEFLTRYGFLEQLTKREWLLRKRLDLPAPADSVAILQGMVADR